MYQYSHCAGPSWSCCLRACLPHCCMLIASQLFQHSAAARSLFRPLMELLFARLPPPLRTSAVRRVSKFLLESTLTSVGAEASVLCNAVAWADPQVGAGCSDLLPVGGVGLTAGLTTDVGAELQWSKMWCRWAPSLLLRTACPPCQVYNTTIQLQLACRRPQGSCWRRWSSSCPLYFKFSQHCSLSIKPCQDAAEELLAP